MLRFELRHYMYPPIFKPRIMSPLNRGSGLFVRFPGVPPLTRLHARATIYRPSPGLINSAGRARHEERLTALMVRPMRGEVRLRHAPQ